MVLIFRSQSVYIASIWTDGTSWRCFVVSLKLFNFAFSRFKYPFHHDETLYLLYTGRCVAPVDCSSADFSETIFPIKFDHAIMNLPQTAIEFLDIFRGFSLPGDNGVRCKF